MRVRVRVRVGVRAGRGGTSERDRTKGYFLCSIGCSKRVEVVSLDTQDSVTPVITTYLLTYK